MKKNFTLFKTLLVAVGLCTGVSAEGQVSTWQAASGTYASGQQIKGSTTGVITMTLGNDNGWVYDSGRSGLVTRTQQSATVTNNIPTAGGYVVLTPTRDLNLSMSFYSSQSNCNVYVYDSNGTKLFDFREKAYNTHDLGKLLAGENYYVYGGGWKAAGDATNLEYLFFRNFTATTYENYTIHYVDDSETPVTIKDDVTYSGLYGASVSASEEDMAQITYGGNSYAYSSGNAAITLGTGSNEITLVYTNVSSANYTIKYVDGENNPIADDVVTESFVGAEVTASGENLPTYITKDGKKYKYTSGNTTLTVTSTESNNVITLVYNEAEKYSYTVKSSTGSTIQSGSEYENEVITYYWYAVLNVGGTLYSAPSVNSQYKASFTLDENNKEVIVNYTASETITNLLYLAEGEDVFIEGTGSNADIRCSMGKGGYASEKMAIVTLPAGTYNLFLSNRCGSDQTGVHKFYLGDATEPFFSANGNGYNANRGPQEFTIDSPTTIYMQGGSNQNLVDYLYIYGEAVTTVSKTISAAGWATYCSPYALDFTGTGLTAYIVTDADAEGNLEKTEVYTVPANTGVLLKGAARDYDIPVVASSSTDVTLNKMVGVTAETQLAAKSIWVLMGSPKIGFYCNSNAFTVGANTAYIPVDEDKFAAPAETIGAKTRFFALDGGNATAINGIESEKNADNAAIYNLAGQRVNAGYKGIVIKNGKKFMNK